MGFLSTLGKLGKAAVGFIPGVGPAVKLGLDKAFDAAGAIGDVSSTLGKQQQGKAEGAIKQADVTQAQDRNALQRFEAMQRAQQEAARMDLDRKKYSGDEQQRNARNALMSSLLKGGIAPTRVGVQGITPASISGGMLDTLKNNPDALAALATLQGKATEGLNTPPEFTGGAMLQAPELTKLPDLGAGNGFLNTMANIGELVGAAGKNYGRTPAPLPPQMPTIAGLNTGLPGQDLGIPQVPTSRRPVRAEDDPEL